MYIAAWFTILGALLWALSHFLRRDDQPIAQPFVSRLSQGRVAADCETCGNAGTINPTMPWKKLSITNQLAMANQITCPCCQGSCVHWIPKDSKHICHRYVG